MKKASSVLLSLFVFLLTLVPPPAVGASPRGGPQRPGWRPVERHAGAIPGSYLVMLRDDTPAGQVEKVARGLARAHGGSAVALYRHALRGFAARLSERAAEALARDPRVALVEEDAVVELAATQVNPPWGLDRTDQRHLSLSGTYAYASTGAGAHVYIIDSGIRTTHEEFGGRASVAFDNVGDSQNGEDCFGHGTQVAGVVGGQTYGAAKEAELHAVRIFNCQNGGSSITKLVEAIDFITGEHQSPAVVVLSISATGSSTLDTAIQNSIAAGLSYVVAAGNSNVDAGTRSPARVAEAITVGATDSSDARAIFSNYGASLDLFAPGVDIPTANWFDDTSTITQSGTSLAAAHVAGLAARYLGANPNETPAAVSEAITSNATADKVSSPGTDSPNLLLYRAGGVPGGCFDDDSIGGCQDMLGPCHWLVSYASLSMSIYHLLRDDGYGPKAMVGTLPPFPREDDSHYLRAFKYGLDVPAGESVTAVTVTVERRMSEGVDGSEIVDNAVHLVKDGVVQTAVNKADTATPWATGGGGNLGWVSQSYVFTGSDLSGWTAADFEDDDFGVAFSAKLRMGGDEELINTEAEVDTIIVTLTTGTAWW